MIPESIQIYLASVAGCEIEASLLTDFEKEPEEVKVWEMALMYMYRFEQKYTDVDFIINDLLVKNLSVFHVLLVASDNSGKKCNRQIMEMVDIYLKKGFSLDHYSEDGLTPLQEAIIVRNIPMAKLFLDSGANIDLVVKKDDTKITGFTAKEMVTYFNSKNQDKIDLLISH